MRRFIAIAAVVGICSLYSAPGAQGAASTPMGDQLVGDCGTTDHGPGCSDAACEACVCAADADCCAADWDEDCLFEAGQCHAECFAVVGDCGDPHDSPGCSDAACEACVCGEFLQGQCCANPWGSACVEAAAGALFGDDVCANTCLIARRQNVPALAAPGIAALFTVFGALAWHRLRRRRV